MKARHSLFKFLTAAAVLVWLSGCATPPAPFDYGPFQQAKPATLLVLPPVNATPDIKATPALWASATRPLAEAGYYVLPAALVDETFRQNGVDSAADAQQIPVAKLRDYFGADAAVYINVTSYGSVFKGLSSEINVAASAKVVDLRTGTELWSGTALASSRQDQSNQNSGSLLGALVSAVVQQVVNNVSDVSFKYADRAGFILLTDKRVNGILPGPRSPNAGKPFKAP